MFQAGGYKNLFLGPIASLPIALITIGITWTLIWKGFGLWRSAQNNQKAWFIAIFILNTLGLLPILYLAFFQKKVKAKKS